MFNIDNSPPGQLLRPVLAVLGSLRWKGPVGVPSKACRVRGAGGSSLWTLLWVFLGSPLRRIVRICRGRIQGGGPWGPVPRDRGLRPQPVRTEAARSLRTSSARCHDRGSSFPVRKLTTSFSGIGITGDPAVRWSRLASHRAFKITPVQSEELGAVLLRFGNMVRDAPPGGGRINHRHIRSRPFFFAGCRRRFRVSAFRSA